MRGCEPETNSLCKSSKGRAPACACPGARLALLQTVVCVGPLSLALCLLGGCAAIRERFGIDPIQAPASAAPASSTASAGPKPSDASSIVQTGGTDRADVPVTPIENSRDAAPKAQGATPSAGNQVPVSDVREGMPKIPAFPAAGSAPAKLPASLDLSIEAPPKLPGAVPPSQGLGVPTRENSNERIAELFRGATERYQHIDSYIARFRRREVVGTTAKPEELMLIKFRKNPWSVYFKWLGSEGHGREAVYVNGKYDNKLHTLLAAGDVPLMPAGKRFSLSPDSSLVRNSSRHSIHEAGFGSLIDQFARIAAANAKGDTHLGTLRYLGPIKRPEFDQPCEAVEQIIPPGSEQGLLKGGRRLWVFDSATSLPVLVTAHDEANKEVEFYCYDRLQYPANLTEDDFNPDVLWRPK